MSCTLVILTRVKDVLPQGKQSRIVYKIPCSCGKGLHWEDCQEAPHQIARASEGMSGGLHCIVCCCRTCVPTPAPHPMVGDLYCGPSQRTQGTVLLKEAIHIHSTPPPPQERFNRDIGIDLPSCWLTVLKACE